MKRRLTICIANHKGGVGKTTTAVNLATGLASLGYPTVLVDCDPQGNVASFLGLEPGPGLYNLLVTKAKPAEVIERVKGSPLGVIAGDASTVDVETLLRTSPRMRPATALREALEPFSSPSTGSGHRNGRGGKPTVVVLDTAPSLSSVQVAALCAADWLIVPASPEYASETGISALVRAVDELKQEGASLQLLGILPTLVDARSREHRETIESLEAAFPGLILPAVRRRIAIAEAPGRGMSIWDYDPAAAEDYAAVLDNVMKRTGLN